MQLALKSIFNLVLVAALVVSLLGLWAEHHHKGAPAIQTQYVQVPVEKTVTKIQRILVPGPKQIVTIDKPVIVKELGLPKAIEKSPNLQVIADAELKPVKNPDCPKFSAVAIMNTVTGETDILAKQKAPAFFAFESVKEAGVGIGISSKDGEFVQAYGSWTFLRVWKLRTQVYGELDQPLSMGATPEAKAIVREFVRW